MQYAGKRYIQMTVFSQSEIYTEIFILNSLLTGLCKKRQVTDKQQFILSVKL